MTHVRIGLVVPSSNVTVETEMPAILGRHPGADFSFHASRMRMAKVSPEQLAAMVRSRAHQGWIAGGCAHVVGPATITVDGDTAIAVCHSLMVVRQDERFVVRRATANHWAFGRTADGWQVTRRSNRVLDGRAESPRLLLDGVHGAAARVEPQPESTD